jgi:hypothetical protein
VVCGLWNLGWGGRDPRMVEVVGVVEEAGRRRWQKTTATGGGGYCRGRGRHDTMFEVVVFGWNGVTLGSPVTC